MDQTGVAIIQHCKTFVMIAVMMTCQVLKVKHQREIVCLQASVTRKHSLFCLTYQEDR